MNKLILISILLVGLGAVSEAGILDWAQDSVRKLGNGILDTGAGVLNKMGLPGTNMALQLIEKTRKLGNNIVDTTGNVLGVEQHGGVGGDPSAPILNPLDPEEGDPDPHDPHSE